MLILLHLGAKGFVNVIIRNIRGILYFPLMIVAFYFSFVWVSISATIFIISISNIAAVASRIFLIVSFTLSPPYVYIIPYSALYVNIKKVIFFSFFQEFNIADEKFLQIYKTLKLK